MSQFAQGLLGGGLTGLGGAIGGLFGGNNRTSAYHYFNDLGAYGQSLYGFPLYNQGAQAKYGVPQGQNYPSQARAGLDRYTGNVGGMIDQYGQQSGQNLGMFTNALQDFARRSQQSGQMFGGSNLLGQFDSDTRQLERMTGDLREEADLWGQGRERQINSDYDAYTRRASGDLLAGFNNRGLANSTISNAGAAMLGGETERARHSSLQNASESAIDRQMGATRFGADLLASRFGQRPGVFGQAFQTDMAAGQAGVNAASQMFNAQQQLGGQMLGLRTGLADTRLSRESPGELFYPDPFRAASMYGGQPQSSNNGLASSFGAGVSGIGANILGNVFGRSSVQFPQQQQQSYGGGFFGQSLPQWGGFGL